MKNANNFLPEINTDEEYEMAKRDSELFKKIAADILTDHHLLPEPLFLLEGTNIVFSHGKSRIIKIFPPLHKSHFDHEVLTMRHLHNKLSVRTPEIEYSGEINRWPYIIMSRLEGTLLEGLWEKLDHNNKMIQV